MHHQRPVSCSILRSPSSARRTPAVWLALGFVALLASGGCGGGGSETGLEKPVEAPVAPLPSGAHFLLAPEETHYGGTYAQWSQRWWQWVYESPRTGHPLYDLTGADAQTGQIDPVWFLGGLYSLFTVPLTGSVVRNVTIPSGIALFFPIINTAADNTTCAGPDTQFTFTQLRRTCAGAVERVQNVFLEIDGLNVVSSPDLVGAKRYRAQAPAFSAYRTADNIWTDFCGGAVLPARTVSPVASDGLWVMIAPLPSGAHTLHFGGTFPTTGFQIDVTYNITVLP